MIIGVIINNFQVIRVVVNFLISLEVGVGFVVNEALVDLLFQIFGMLNF